MQFQEVEIFIGPDGKVSCEVRGVKGRKCLDLTRELEADLGGEIVSREEPWEMNQAEATFITRTPRPPASAGRRRPG